MAQAQYLTGPQLVGIARKAGFDDPAARTYAAIELAESNGAYNNMADLQAALNGTLAPGNYPGLNYHPAGTVRNGQRIGGPEISIGPGQINIVGLNTTDPKAAHYVDPIKLMADPTYNAHVAFSEKSGGGKNFSPWSTYTSGAYRARLSDVGGQPITPVTYPAPDAATSPAGGQAAEQAGTGAATAPATSCKDQPPVIRFPGVAGVGAVTVLSRCQARAVVGGLAMVGGGVLMLGGVALLAVYGFQSNAARLALKTAGVPGQLVAGHQQSKAAGETASQKADVQQSELQARAASAEARRAAAEERTSRVMAARAENANRHRGREYARQGRTLPGEEPF